MVDRFAAASSTTALDVAQLRDALDATWRSAMGESADVEGARQLAEGAVPHEDEGWVTEAGYAQNAIEAIAYAARTWITDDPQEAVWAARQVYEAADYAAQQELDESEDRFTAPGLEARLARSPIVTAAVNVIASDLALAGQQSAELVRKRCRAEATDLAARFT